MARQQKAEICDAAPAAEPVKSLFDRVAVYLDTHDWNYTAYQDKNYISTNCRFKEGSARVIVDVYEAEDWQRVLVYTTLPVYVPELRRSAVTESITRINYKTMYGNLEMDLADGEIRARTIAESDKCLSDSMIERVLDSNLGTVSRYFSPLLAVAFGNGAPETVLDVAEKRDGATLQ